VAKETIYVGLGVVGDGPLPRKDGLVSLAAAVGEDVFQVNILSPGGGAWDPGKHWGKYPEEWTQVTKDPVPLKDGIKQYQAWLGRYHGRHLACCSALTFYWVFETLIQETGRCSFGSNGHVDTRSVIAARTGDFSMQGKRFSESILPWEVAKANWEMVVNGQKGGVVPPKKRSLFGEYFQEGAFAPPQAQPHRLRHWGDAGVVNNVQFIPQNLDQVLAQANPAPEPEF